MKIWYFYIGLIIVLIMSACSSNGQGLEEQLVIPQPEPGMASVTGRVLSRVLILSFNVFVNIRPDESALSFISLPILQIIIEG